MDKTLGSLSRDDLAEKASKHILEITKDWPKTHFDIDEDGYLKKPEEWSESLWKTFCEA
jgi:hypothetical protein